MCGRENLRVGLCFGERQRVGKGGAREDSSMGRAGGGHGCRHILKGDALGCESDDSRREAATK